MTVVKFMTGILTGCGVALGLAWNAQADTGESKWETRVVVERQGAHCADDPNCMNRYHPAIPPVAHANPGDLITLSTRDAVDSDFTLDSVNNDVTSLDLNLVHPMTGPVYINGSKRGDVLAVTLIDIEPDEYGYTLIVPGFGFLRDLYPDPYIANWRLSRTHAESDQLPGIKVPMAAFMGSVGVLVGDPEIDAILAREGGLSAAGGIALPPEPTGAQPAAVCGPNGSHKERCLRTIPPRENGGNMDVQQMQVGTTLLLPCFVDGCGLFSGDVHYAQGDGEVSGTAIEMGARVTVRTEIRKGQGAFIKWPHFEGGAQLKTIEPSSFYATTGVPVKKPGEVPPTHQYLSDQVIDLGNLNEDLSLAARNALVDMIDYIVREKGLTREQAYVLSSVAVDLRIGQVVDLPNYIVSAVLDLGVFQ